jgi:hypothetical protein
MAAYRFSRSILGAGGRSEKGHEERFPPTRLSARFGFRKETIEGMRRNGRDAREAVIGRPRLSGSTLPTRKEVELADAAYPFKGRSRVPSTSPMPRRLLKLVGGV